MQSTELTRRSLLGAISGSILVAGCTGDDGSGNGGDGNENGDDASGNSDDGSGNGDDGSGNGDDGSGNGDDGSGNGDDGSGNGDSDGMENGDDESGNGDDDGSGNGDDDGSGNGDDDGSGNGDDGMENGDEQQEVVQVLSNDEYGDILAGPDGRTLYMFDSDERGSGESSCSGGCADSWPPLTVDGEPAAGSGVDAELSTIERGDGTTQVTANGWPLYYFANDESQGDATGQGVNDVWWVLAPDGTPVRDTGGGDGSDDGDDSNGGDDGDGANGGDDGDDGDDGNGGDGDDPGPY